jgi:hypothetical protein
LAIARLGPLDGAGARDDGDGVDDGDDDALAGVGVGARDDGSAHGGDNGVSNTLTTLR